MIISFHKASSTESCPMHLISIRYFPMVSRNLVLQSICMLHAPQVSVNSIPFWSKEFIFSFVFKMSVGGNLLYVVWFNTTLKTLVLPQLPELYACLVFLLYDDDPVVWLLNFELLGQTPLHLVRFKQPGSISRSHIKILSQKRTHESLMVNDSVLKWYDNVKCSLFILLIVRIQILIECFIDCYPDNCFMLFLYYLNVQTRVAGYTGFVIIAPYLLGPYYWRRKFLEWGEVCIFTIDLL